MSARRGCPLSNRCGRPRTGTEACPYIPIGLVCGSDIYAPRSWLLYDDANGCAAERLIGRDDPKEMKSRKTNRMREYDYSRPGHYFVTICVQGRKELFGEIINDRMMTNAAGAMVEETWRGLPKYYRGIQMDEFQAMPNHVHGIIVITGNEFHHRTVGTGRDLSLRNHRVPRRTGTEACPYRPFRKGQAANRPCNPRPPVPHSSPPSIPHSSIGQTLVPHPRLTIIPR